MLERFSVRKPFTVLVGVILVIVLGVVSFTNTSTDLLPAMDLPFSAVFTTYIGATPEQVERDISIPLEGRLSTLSGIQSVQSISNEHVSIIILSFTDNTNMDTASLEIREALDMMNLPDGASRPMTIRMNPEMLPILSASIYMEGVSIDELSDFATNEVAPALEGVPGVAMVNLSGLVQNQMHVVLRSEYVEAINQGLAQAVHTMMEMAMAEINQQIEAAVAMQVEAATDARMAELLQDELSPEEAGLQLQQELPYIIEQVTQEVIYAMAAEAEGGGFGGMELDAIGVPAEMLTVDTIMGILMAQNFSMPAGMITDSDVEYMVRVGDRFNDLYEIQNMLIFDPGTMGIPGLEPIRLQDVADVFVTDDSYRSFTRVNGHPSVMLSIQRQSEFSTADIAGAVRDRMDLLMEEHDGLGFAVLMDQGEMIGMVIGSVISNLLWGGLLAIVILLLFLRDLRPTLIVAVSIPVSLMLAFTLMYFTGVSLNMVSMGGLALAVGMLVDNSIVVIENIYRMRATTGRSAARAAVSGAKQVAGAITVASITTICVFFPIVFTGGMTRMIFADLALTIAFSLMASLIIALTVVPAASSILLKNMKQEKLQEGKFFAKFVNWYESSLRVALRFKWAVLLFAAVAFVISLWALLQRGMELFPPMDAPQINVSAEMPEGSTFDETVIVAEKLSERVLAIADVETVGVNVGGGGMMGAMAASFGMGGMAGGGGTNINMDILLADDRSMSQEEVNEQIRSITEDLGLEASIGGADGGMGMMAGDAISIRIEGRELDDIRDTAIAIADLVRTVDGTLNVTDMVQQGAPELRISVDKDRAMAHGLTVAQVFMAVNGEITVPEHSFEMNVAGRNYEIVVSDGDFIAPTKADIQNMQIATLSGFVQLSDIAEVYEDIGFTSINRIDRNRFVTVSGEIEEGFNVTLVNQEIQNLLDDFTPIGDTTIHIGGEMEAIADAFGDLLLMLGLAVVLIYLIMVAQFQSLLSPFIIMFTIPLAFTGGFVALMVAGTPLSIVAMIGLILLAGVSTNNGIVLISRVNQMRWEGMSKKDAIIDSGRKRIRPILMMAISTIFAMSVMAFGIGEGAEMMQPMAIATIGGLIYGTLMTLYVVPVLYDMFHRNKDITLENLDDDVDIVE